MKLLRKSLPFLLLTLLFAPLPRAQDLSKYRGVAIGMKLTTVLKQTEQTTADVQTIHQKPIVLQELTWWPSLPQGSLNYRTDSVREVLLSFDNGVLYKMTVSYERNAVEGLTRTDLVASISAKYGEPTKASMDGIAADPRQDTDLKIVARWEDPQYSIDLVRSSSNDAFRLILFSKRVNAEADLASIEALRLEKEERPQVEADRAKKESDNLEIARQKNLKVFHP